MKIEKTHHESGLGIYAGSVPVMPADMKTAQKIAKEMIAWFNKENGNFDGEFETALAMAHCQVAPIATPWQLFIVAKDLVNPKPPEKLKDGKTNPQKLVNHFFEGQAIFNCMILENPNVIKRKVPQRTVGDEKDGKVPIKMEMVDKTVDNVINVPEGCMSFRHRKEKNVDRFFSVKVRYQYLKKGLFGSKVETFEGWVEGMKAHIIQHECQHFEGKNIYFKT